MCHEYSVTTHIHILSSHCQCCDRCPKSREAIEAIFFYFDVGTHNINTHANLQSIGDVKFVYIIKTIKHACPCTNTCMKYKVHSCMFSPPLLCKQLYTEVCLMTFNVDTVEHYILLG